MTAPIRRIGVLAVLAALWVAACSGGAPAPTADPPAVPPTTAATAAPRLALTPLVEQACDLAGETGGDASAYGVGTRESPSCGQPTPYLSPAPSATVTASPAPTLAAAATSTPTATPTASPMPTATPQPTAAATPDLATLTRVRLAAIGDYGLSNPAEGDVADLVKSWSPLAVITLGDNNYLVGSAETIDHNIGQYYADFIHPYTGAYGPGAEVNRFFPILGNHDWQTAAAQPYLDYFTLPGNERYYDVRIGPVHLFALDSQPDEPDGITADSRQAAWLRDALAASDAPWKLVTLHHPPYSSGPHAPSVALRWPFAEWGATAVLSGHDHIYERVMRDGIVYFVNGLGGSIIYDIGHPVGGSVARYNDDFGAMLIEANGERITFSFITRTGLVIDTHTIVR